MNVVLLEFQQCAEWHHPVGTTF